MCYAFPRYRLELESYIAFIYNNYDAELRAEKLDDKIKYEQLQTMHLSVNDIDFLLYGFENGSVSNLNNLLWDECLLLASQS
jgi:hypothetical protein